MKKLKLGITFSQPVFVLKKNSDETKFFARELIGTYTKKELDQLDDWFTDIPFLCMFVYGKLIRAGSEAELLAKLEFSGIADRAVWFKPEEFPMQKDLMELIMKFNPESIDDDAT